MSAKINALCGYIAYCTANYDRTDIHNLICDYVGVKHDDAEMQRITNNLDKEIGFDVDKDYEKEEVREFAIKLADKFNRIGRNSD